MVVESLVISDIRNATLTLLPKMGSFSFPLYIDMCENDWPTTASNSQ